jgi:hypothetical protein
VNLIKKRESEATRFNKDVIKDHMCEWNMNLIKKREREAT